MKAEIKNVCAEFASDCEMNSSASLAFHLNVGFTEAGRIICLKKNYKIKTAIFL